MNLLLKGRLMPLTSNIGFIEAPCQEAAEAIIRFHAEKEKEAGRNVTLHTRDVDGDLETALRALLPFTNSEIRRHLLIPTASNWTAYLNNHWQGTDLGSFEYYLPMSIGRRAVTIRAAERTVRKMPDGVYRGHYGIREFGVFAPHATQNSGENVIRLVRILGDVNGFGYDAFGDPLPFEDVAQYSARRISDRLTLDMLAQYANQLGLRPFDESFYLPGDTSAVLIEKRGDVNPRMREYSLEEVQARYLYA